MGVNRPAGRRAARDSRRALPLLRLGDPAIAFATQSTTYLLCRACEHVWQTGAPPRRLDLDGVPNHPPEDDPAAALTASSSRLLIRVGLQNLRPASGSSNRTTAWCGRSTPPRPLRAHGSPRAARIRPAATRRDRSRMELPERHRLLQVDRLRRGAVPCLTASSCRRAAAASASRPRANRDTRRRPSRDRRRCRRRRRKPWRCAPDRLPRPPTGCRARRLASGRESGYSFWMSNRTWRWPPAASSRPATPAIAFR